MPVKYRFPLNKYDQEAFDTLKEATLAPAHIEILFNNLDESDQETVLKNLAISKDYSYVKVKTAAQRDALENFVTTELFPLYNDQLTSFII